MVKSLKDYVPAICKEPHGHLVLLRLFDVVDDTVLVGKYIIAVRGPLRRARALRAAWPRVAHVARHATSMLPCCLQEMVKDMDALVRDKIGRKPFLYLLAGRSKSYFFPDTLKLLAAGDAVRALTRCVPAWQARLRVRGSRARLTAALRSRLLERGAWVDGRRGLSAKRMRTSARRSCGRTCRPHSWRRFRPTLRSSGGITTPPRS